MPPFIHSSQPGIHLRPGIVKQGPAGLNSDKRVLVVDDYEDAVDIMKIVLELMGYQVQTAMDGLSALKIAATFNPDIALLDVGLPSMDGYELAKRLRAAQGSVHALHLVAVTGSGADSDRERSAAAGFERHLLKPVDVNNLERTLSGLY